MILYHILPFQVFNGAKHWQLHPKKEIRISICSSVWCVETKSFIYWVFMSFSAMAVNSTHPQAMADFDLVSHILDGYTPQMIGHAQPFGVYMAPRMVDDPYDPDNMMDLCFAEASPSDFNSHDVTRDEPKADQVGLIFKFRVVEKLTPLKLTNEVLSLHMKNAINHRDFNGNPKQLRKILRSQYGGHAQVFSKNVKKDVTSSSVIQASAARRKCEARFVCPIEGCTNNFTRRHNLNGKHWHVSLFSVSFGLTLLT